MNEPRDPNERCPDNDIYQMNYGVKVGTACTDCNEPLAKVWDAFIAYGDTGQRCKDCWWSWIDSYEGPLKDESNRDKDIASNGGGRKKKPC